MVELRAPNGALVQARDDAVQGLLDAGFNRIEKPTQAAPRKKATSRTAKRKTARG